MRGDRRGVTLALALFTVALLSSALLTSMTRVALDVQGVLYRQDQLQARAAAHAGIDVTVRSGRAFTRDPISSHAVTFTSEQMGRVHVVRRDAVAPDLVAVEVEATHGKGFADAGVILRVSSEDR